jgi:hypothetical protein
MDDFCARRDVNISRGNDSSVDGCENSIIRTRTFNELLDNAISQSIVCPGGNGCSFDIARRHFGANQNTREAMVHNDNSLLSGGLMGPWRWKATG